MSFLDLEQLMIDRLVSQLPSSVRVMSASDLAAVPANSQVAPAVHVIYGGFQVQSSKNDRKSAKVRQIWYAVPVVRNVANQIDGKGARSAAGELVDQTFEALMGWTPSAAHRPLELITPPGPRWIKGLGYHPLAFASETEVGSSLPRN